MKRSYLNSIGTAVPMEPILQSKIATFMAETSGLTDDARKKLEILYRASGISSRYSVIPDFSLERGQFEFFSNAIDFLPLPSVQERMNLYKNKALPLCVESISKTVCSIDVKSITHLITFSCTGMYAPGLDIDLVQAIGIPTDVIRTSINYMGCYAAFNAIKVADAFCKSAIDAVVLVVGVELCTIHYKNSLDHDAILSNALFGDGATSFIVQSTKPRVKSLELDSFHCDLALEGKKEMEWNISNDGFEMKLSGEVPEYLRNGVSELLGRLIEKSYSTFSEIDAFAIHPGGKRILEVIGEELEVDKEKMKESYEILRKFGNMSSVTILFVLKEIMDSSNSEELKKIACIAFGPGLTMESLLMNFHKASESNSPMHESRQPEFQFYS